MYSHLESGLSKKAWVWLIRTSNTTTQIKLINLLKLKLNQIELGLIKRANDAG